MKITRKSNLTGIERTLDLDATEDQLASWENGTSIQNAFPNLSADDREFILTGMTAGEWNSLFSSGHEQ